MYELALTCDNLTEKEYWLREAAYENYLPAMFELALMSTDVFRRRVWLRRAAENGHLVAMHRLGQESRNPSREAALAAHGRRGGVCPRHVRPGNVVGQRAKASGGLARPLEMAFRRPSWSWRTEGTERRIPATGLSSHVFLTSFFSNTFLQWTTTTMIAYQGCRCAGCGAAPPARRWTSTASDCRYVTDVHRRMRSGNAPRRCVPTGTNWNSGAAGTDFPAMWPTTCELCVWGKSP